MHNSLKQKHRHLLTLTHNHHLNILNPRHNSLNHKHRIILLPTLMMSYSYKNLKITTLTLNLNMLLWMKKQTLLLTLMRNLKTLGLIKTIKIVVGFQNPLGEG